VVLGARTHRFAFMILYLVHVLSVLSCTRIDSKDTMGDLDTELFIKCYLLIFNYYSTIFIRISYLTSWQEGLDQKQSQNDKSETTFI
jgi:hypothetical protein